MGLIDVDVTDTSNNLDMELTQGGTIEVQTQWLDYDGNSRNLSEISDAAVLIDIGFGMKWLEDVDDNGRLNLLFYLMEMSNSQRF